MLLDQVDGTEEAAVAAFTSYIYANSYISPAEATGFIPEREDAIPRWAKRI